MELIVLLIGLKETNAFPKVRKPAKCSVMAYRLFEAILSMMEIRVLIKKAFT